MTRVKFLGCEIDLSLTYFYGSFCLIGEVCVEMRSVVKGRWWLDYMYDKGCLELFVGRTHIILCRPYQPTSNRNDLSAA